MAWPPRKVLLIGVPIVAFALTGIVLLVFYFDWQMVDPPLLQIAGILVPVMVAIALVIARGLSGRKRFNTIVGVTAVGVSVMTLVGFGYLTMINAVFDDSAPREHRAKIKEINHSRGWWRSVVVESWQVAGDRQKLWVRDSVLKPKPSHLIVTTRAGALGIEWVEDVKRAP